MDPHQEVQVCLDHPDLQYPGPFLMRHPTEKGAQEPRQPSIDETLAVASRPDDVTVDAVDHTGNLRPTR